VKSPFSFADELFSDERIMTKNRTGQIVLVLSILLLSQLTVLSIIGAFAGAERSKLFFNSPQMAVFWGILFLLLLGGFFFWPVLRRRKMLLLIHAGIVLILAGGIIGSERSHAFFNRRSSTPRPVRALMPLHEGQTSKTAFLDDGQPVELPFEVRLKKAAIEYYPSSQMPKDYLSDLEIIDDGVLVKAAQIEVNKPLYYKGYHFYQNTFTVEDSVPVSGLLVVSSRGVGTVFAGYALAAIGLFGHFLPVVFRKKASREVPE
jgi:hypothetical protein